jgi:hypothetical protein
VTASRRRGYCKNKSCRALVLAEVLYEHDGLCESCAADQLELPIQAPERGSAYGT